MAYDICSICGRMYEKTGRQYCEICFEENEREYKLILEYIENNPNNTVLEIINETNVSFKTINRLVEDGVISYKDKKNFQ